MEVVLIFVRRVLICSRVGWYLSGGDDKRGFSEEGSQVRLGCRERPAATSGVEDSRSKGRFCLAAKCHRIFSVRAALGFFKVSFKSSPFRKRRGNSFYLPWKADWLS